MLENEDTKLKEEIKIKIKSKSHTKKLKAVKVLP